LISELGEDRNRFPAVEALLAEAGLAPVTKACGRTRQVRFRYAANRRMRHAIDWWVFAAAREDAWSEIVYQTARSRGQGSTERCSDSAPVGCGVLWRCWIDHSCYDPTRHPRPELLAHRFGHRCPTVAPAAGSRLAAGHPTGPDLDRGEDATTLRHARTTICKSLRG
jgi:Transposase IS116/IS110/IS902 family